MLQIPVTHWLVPVHAVPFVRFVSHKLVAVLQKAVEAHCVSFAQVVRHAGDGVAVQLNGAQLVRPGAGHVPVLQRG